jgi:fucose permease
MTLDRAQQGRWAVAACFFVNGLIMGSWVPQIPLLAQRFELQEWALGLIILTVGAGAVLAMPLCGWLISRTNSRTVVRGSAVLCAFALLLVAVAPSLLFVVPTVILFGGVIGGMDVAMNSNAVAVERRIGTAIMSSSHGFWSLGGFTGAGLGGKLAEMLGHVGHAGVVTALIILILSIALPRLIVEAQEVCSMAERPRSNGFPRQPGVYLIGLTALLCMMPEGAVLDWAALYLQQEMGASLATASLAFTFFSGTMAVMRFVGDGLRNRLGAVTTVRISGTIAAVGMLAAGSASNPIVAICAFALAGVGIANMVPIVFSAAGNQPGVAPAIGMSVATTVGYSGILVAPSIVGFLAARIGFSPIFIGFAGVLMMVVLLASRMKSADTITTQPSPDPVV